MEMLTEGKEYMKETEVTTETSLVPFKMRGHTLKIKGQDQEAQIKQQQQQIQ